MKKTENIIKVILSILFLICLFDMPYAYYQLVRFFGMFGFSILAYVDYEKNKTWFVIWLSSAILINPFFKIALGRDLWNFIDIIWAILLIINILKEFRRKRKLSK